ncbi:NUDIX domain-containing protein [Alkaliphilus serpentinus]|uniref:NUDIX hydrolase n=1 Tax=Alkaliphilus serpentinus TaxID=1482731 RepID=A0A833HQ21_9FIRM|nr:NUDIX hydrolase [Alkaliphilus serpentinus]KAB3531470.1 NUDIX hydrolase [Alkaliphilus serpentinus]
MLFRDCAGGVVFYANKVLLLKNEKNEWILPKGAIRNGDLTSEVALKRVKIEAGVEAEILSTVGETSYEFFSVTRQIPVNNRITWYIMQANSKDFSVNKELNFKDGGFFPIDKALRMITYSQDKSLVSLSYKKYKELMKEKATSIAI